MNDILFIEDFHKPLDRNGVPDTWEIYNAPRPLYGTKTWTNPQGMRSGWFFAAIDPDDQYADRWREETRRLHGQLCVNVSRKTVEDWVQWYYKRLIDDGDLDIGEFTYRNWCDSYLTHLDDTEPY